jgi:hypothetical protein
VLTDLHHFESMAWASAQTCAINHGLDALRMILAPEPIIAVSLSDDSEPGQAPVATS